jgi:hypothetical protein
MEREVWRPEWTPDAAAEWDHAQSEGLTLQWLLDHYEECYHFIDARISARKTGGASAGGLARHGGGKAKRSVAKKSQRQKKPEKGGAAPTRGRAARAR